MSTRTDLICESNATAIEKKLLYGTMITTQKSGEDVFYTVSYRRVDGISNTKSTEDAILVVLNKEIGQKYENFLVVGLGNADVTPDALGVRTAQKILATRHLKGDLENIGGKLKSVCCLIPDVKGKTGIDSKEIIHSVCQKVKPDCVIIIDALAAADKSRLFSTVQLTNRGIAPASGVSANRQRLSKEVLKIPVFSIGIPTVTDAYGDGSMMVTPKEVDILVELSSSLLARTLNRFLQPEIDTDLLNGLV